MTNPSKLPLVSVLCRSMNRSELQDALHSVNQQTYNNIEIVLVDASGKGLDQHKNLFIRFPVFEVSESHQLNRPAAANKALKSANGSYLMFLDEDDWIDPEHVQQLVSTLEENPDIGVVYSSTQKTLVSGEATAESLCIPYDRARLRRDNFIPIHAAIFRRSLISNDVQFDESLDVFEDWDFWLQLAQQTDFLHLDVVTAFYREGGNSNTASDDPMTRYRAGHPIADARERVFDKWLPQWKGSDLNQVLASLDKEMLIQNLQTDLHRLNNDVHILNNDLHRLNKHITVLTNETRKLKHTATKLNQTVNRKDAELQESRTHADHLTQYIHMLKGSLSWRLTRPLRWFRRNIDALRSDHKQTLPAPETISCIKANLELPNAQQNEIVDQLILAGWCFSRNGIDRIDALIDGLLLSSFSNGVSRPDVAKLFPGLPESVNAGFNHQLTLQNLSPAEHQLELIIHDNAGEHINITCTFSTETSKKRYNSWYWRNQPDDYELMQYKSNAENMASNTRPVFHLLVTDVIEEKLFLPTLCSVAEQAWPHWVLHVQSPRLQYAEDYLQQTYGRSIYINWHQFLPAAIKEIPVDSHWLLFLKSGETLAPHALAEFASLAQCQDSGLLYSDHDVVNDVGEHMEPTFTPQWSPEHLMSNNYIGGVFAFRGELLRQWQSIDFLSTAWRYAALLRIAQAAVASQGKIQRVAKVLWSSLNGDSAMSSAEDETHALRDWLAESQPDAEVQDRGQGIRAVLWPLTDRPKVSIIIPTMGMLDPLQPCIDSLLEKTSYTNYELVILDNSRGKFPSGIQYLKDRQLKVIECDEAFNWARLSNIGARHASGEFYLFLNDDIEITTCDWLEQLLRLALRPDVGTVGALLNYPNGALQHAGLIIVNYGGGGKHLLHRLMPSDNIYRQMHRTVREVSANTGACLMVACDKFDELGGFDEELAVVGNDLDLCLRLLERGYRNVWTPLCHLVHHESISRKDTVPKEDEKSMWHRWRERFLAGDTFYNPNLSTDLCDFTLRMDPAGNQSEQITTAPTKSLLPGVNLIGYARAEMGIGEGARSDARALDAVDEPFGIICVTAGNPSRMNDLSWEHKEIDSAPFDITLLHINPDHAFQIITGLPSSYFDNHYRVGYWAWELPEIPQQWESAFLHFDEIWVPSSFVQDAVAMKSPVPVVRIPHSIEISFDSAVTRSHLGLPDNTFLFLMMFDTHSRHERKNPYGAIEAFRGAFAADDLSVRLVIKVNNSSPEFLAVLRKRAGDHQNILFLHKVYSRQDVNAIIANCDCFVSLHRSEGFGLGPAEAMALGKVIIATNWSGNTDYMRPDNSMGIDYQLVVLDEDFGPYKKGQIWAEPDIEHASVAMATLAGNKDLAQRLGDKARQTIENEFSPHAVGRMIKKRLTAIRTRMT